MEILPCHKKKVAGRLRTADIMAKVNSAIITDRLYLNPELKCRDIANAIGSNRTYVWQALSRQKVGFREYLARFRLHYFIRNAHCFAGMSGMEIAERCGFNDRKALNKCLKKALGLSLAEYMHLFSRDF